MKYLNRNSNNSGQGLVTFLMISLVLVGGIMVVVHQSTESLKASETARIANHIHTIAQESRNAFVSSEICSQAVTLQSIPAQLPAATGQWDVTIHSATSHLTQGTIYEALRISQMRLVPVVASPGPTHKLITELQRVPSGYTITSEIELNLTIGSSGNLVNCQLYNQPSSSGGTTPGCTGSGPSMACPIPVVTTGSSGGSGNWASERADFCIQFTGDPLCRPAKTLSHPYNPSLAVPSGMNDAAWGLRTIAMAELLTPSGTECPQAEAADDVQGFPTTGGALTLNCKPLAGAPVCGPPASCTGQCCWTIGTQHSVYTAGVQGPLSPGTCAAALPAMSTCSLQAGGPGCTGGQQFYCPSGGGNPCAPITPSFLATSCAPCVASAQHITTFPHVVGGVTLATQTQANGCAAAGGWVFHGTSFGSSGIAPTMGAALAGSGIGGSNWAADVCHNATAFVPHPGFSTAWTGIRCKPKTFGSCPTIFQCRF